MSAIGLRIGPYEIVGRTTVPEPGDWHLARRTGGSRRGPAEVLVRLLPPDAGPDDREALHHQYEVLRALEDPRVPDVVNFYEGLGAMAIEAVHGASLADIVKGREGDVVQMSPSTLLDVVLELAETLQRAHHRNRFHGDLSPDRVLLGADGRLWVFGFGDPLGSEPHPHWVAPEVRDGGEADARTDQWYLGVLGAALVGGGEPWPNGVSAPDVNALLEPAERQWPTLGRLLRRMTEPDPADRHPTMHPVRQELLALARKAGGLSARRELGGDLARPRALDISGEPVPRPAPEPSPPRDEAPPLPELPPDGFSPPGQVPPADPGAAPTPDVEVELTISEEYEQTPDPAGTRHPTPDPATQEGRTPLAPQRVGELPDEDFVVVRPDVGTEVPEAAIGTPPPAEPRGLGAPLAETPSPAPRSPLPADVVIEDTDPDASPPFPPERDMYEPLSDPSVPSVFDDDPQQLEPNPFATDLTAELEADAAEAPGAGDGLSWDDLAREFHTDPGPGANETILPPSAPSEPDEEDSSETERSEPRLLNVPAQGPGADASLGIGALPDDAPTIQGLSDEQAIPEAEPAAVATGTLVTRVAPIALGVFVVLWVIWLVVWLLG